MSSPAEGAIVTRGLRTEAESSCLERYRTPWQLNAAPGSAIARASSRVSASKYVVLGAGS